MTERPALQAYYPFTRLSRLLEGVAPGSAPSVDGAPILLSVGEPQRAPPAFVGEEIARHLADLGRYPLPRGTADYRAAAVDWLIRRYDLPPNSGAPGGMIDPEHTLLPLPGSREGLFFSVLATVGRGAGQVPPVVLMPNPFYHVYAGAALAAGAEPVFVAATKENGFVPDFAALAPDVLERAAYCFLCTPSNPQGAVASLAQLSELILLARRFDFVLAFDECYTELYNGEPPPGALQAAASLGGSLDHLLIFHSLSKRSSAPGLRCGFVVGDPDLITLVDESLRVGGAGVPGPVLAAGARLWRDQAHVAEARGFYRRNFAIAERVLGNRFNFRTPEAGFFLWLEVGDGEAAALELWRACGIKTLPGAYMCADDGDGGNPGRDFLRIALVYDEAVTDAALTSLAETL
ncbi:MAG: aminotransferase class I/II-fold pyridoxal phosphate-dependent enzyme [Pseudomonadota bacterium]